MTAPRKINGIEVALIDKIAAHHEAQIRTCQKKVRYADEHVARAVGIERMADTPEQRYIYQCKFCRGWHLTRQEQPAYYAADYLEKEGYK